MLVLKDLQTWQHLWVL